MSVKIEKWFEEKYYEKDIAFAQMVAFNLINNVYENDLSSLYFLVTNLQNRFKYTVSITPDWYQRQKHKHSDDKEFEILDNFLSENLVTNNICQKCLCIKKILIFTKLCFECSKCENCKKLLSDGRYIQCDNYTHYGC